VARATPSSSDVPSRRLRKQAGAVDSRGYLDAAVQSNGAVYGKDVRADIELDLAQYGWVPLLASDFTGTGNPAPPQQQLTTPPRPVKVVPLGQNAAAPVPAGNSSNARSRTSAKPAARPGGFVIPAIVLILLKYVGIPVLAVLALVTALISAKALRRRRRRTRGPPATRAALAWRELLDLGRDLGVPSAAPTATRREQAVVAEARGLPAAAVAAAAADAAVFGEADPDDVAACRDGPAITTAARLGRGQPGKPVLPALLAAPGGGWIPAGRCQVDRQSKGNLLDRRMPGPFGIRISGFRRARSGGGGSRGARRRGRSRGGYRSRRSRG
jgi:hypothetical protein